MKEYNGMNNQYSFENNNFSNGLNNISGLGESDYENEDLFPVEEIGNEMNNFSTKEVNIPFPLDYPFEQLANYDDLSNFQMPNNLNENNEQLNNTNANIFEDSLLYTPFENQIEGIPAIGPGLPGYVAPILEIPEQQENIIEEQPVVEEVPMFEGSTFEPTVEDETSVVETIEEIPAIGPGLPGYVAPILEIPEQQENIIEEQPVVEEIPMFEEPTVEPIVEEETPFVEPVVEEQPIIEEVPMFEEPTVEPIVEEETPVVEPAVEEQPIVEEVPMFEEPKLEEEPQTVEVIQPTEEEKKKVTLTDTPIEELQKLTEYTEDKIKSTDINSLFDRVGSNVREASDIFQRNTEMKEKLDSRFEELKLLQSQIEKSKKTQYDEIKTYKEEVLGKLTEKKDEIEKRLNKLRDYQSNLEKEKAEFELYKKKEKEEIARVQKEIQDAYDARREELNHIEDVLRKQKDSLDEERSQLSLDLIQYEADKNELANNLLKFNEIVASFTTGVEQLSEKE